MAAGDRFDDPRVFPSQAAFRAWLGKHFLNRAYWHLVPTGRV